MRLILGDCLKILPTLDSGSVSAVVCDPPYEYAFMGKNWDASGVAFRPETWRAVARVLQPAGYLLAFGGTRTFHRLACAIEDAGFELRDTLCWLHGAGFPKSKGCLKPAWEPTLLARKPGGKVRPLGIEECRIATADRFNCANASSGYSGIGGYEAGAGRQSVDRGGRWPANVVLSHHKECNGECHPECAVRLLDEQSGERKVAARGPRRGPMGYQGAAGYDAPDEVRGYGDTGGASRFFYCSKASRRDRGEGNTHPTVKPLALTRWLVKLVCPPGGVVLDPFAGSATTGVACLQTGRDAVLIEREPAYHAIASRRLALAQGPLFAPQPGAAP